MEDNSIGVYISNGRANGRKVYKGPRGGYFYYTFNGTKEHVRQDQIKLNDKAKSSKILNDFINFI
jgi:hypothetical protein